MTKQLYEEALADVKKLKEVAEDNAKKALIEAVAPRIKDLIEAELLREADDENPVDDDLLLDDESMADPQDFAQQPAPDFEPSIGAAAQSLAGAQPDLTAAISMPDEEGKVTLDLGALSDMASPEGVGSIGIDDLEGDEEFAVPEDMAGTMQTMKETAVKGFEKKLLESRNSVRVLANPSSRLRRNPAYGKIVKESIAKVESLYKFLQENIRKSSNKALYENILEKLYKDLNQLAEQNMKKEYLTEEELTFTIKNIDIPEEDLGDVEIEIAPEGGSDEEGGDDLDLDEEGEDEDEGDEEGDDELDLGDEEEGEDEESDELDLGDEEESDEGEEESEELELKEGARKMQSRRLSDNTIVEIDEGMLRREISRMKSLREAAEDVQKWGHGAGEVADDFEDEDLGDPFLDVDVTTEGMDELDELDEEGDDKGEDPAADKQGGKGMDELDELDELDQMDQGMDELDQMDQATDDEDAMGPGAASGQDKEQKRSPQKESILRRLAAERKLQLEAKKKAQAVKQKAKQTQKEQQQKGKQGQKGKQTQKEQQQKQKQKQKMKEAYNYYATQYNESVKRTARLRTMLAEASKRDGESLNGSSARTTGNSDNLRKKLAETNLFNMKLLYTNKLLQNESLTKRQKADVIERLDEATTEREIKLVYESLVKTLSGRTRNLSEGANRVLGSSSAPTRAASTVLNEGFEADRWAKLAGIK